MARNPARGGTLLVELKAVDARLSPLRPARHRARAAARRAPGQRRRRGRGGAPRAARPRDRRPAHDRRRDPDRDRRRPEGARSRGVALHARPARPPERREPRRDGPRPARQPRPPPHARPAPRRASSRARRAPPWWRRWRTPPCASPRSTRPSPGSAASSTSSPPTCASSGVTSLLVGGIGVAAAVRAFLARKVATIAILRCLGASARTLTAVYVVQALALGALGSLAGAVLGTAVQLALGPLLQPFVPFELEARAAPGAVATGLLAGCLATLLFALWPLLSARAVPPAILLRHPVDAGSVRPRRPWATADRGGRRPGRARALAGRPAPDRRHLPRRRPRARSGSSSSPRGPPGGSRDGSRARAPSRGARGSTR